MDKRIAIITSSLPNTFHGGGALTSYGVVKSFIRNNFNIYIITWKLDLEKESKTIKHLENMGVNIYVLAETKKQKLRNVFGMVSGYFPHALHGKEIKNILKKIKPNILFMYHWEALAGVYKIKDIPKIGIVGDPFNLPQLYRIKFDSKWNIFNKRKRILKNFLLRIYGKKKRKIMVNLLNSCDISGAFAYHHSKMLKEWGAKECSYFQTPVPDPFINKVRKENLPNKLKILLLGHLKGIATLSGLEFFAKNLLPTLKKDMGSNNFEVHIVGGYFNDMPDKLKLLLNHQEIKIRGHISPIDDEFLSSHLLLVPTPIELGIRVRIITSFSFGLPVVAHYANAKGIPELKNGENSLLADNGKDLVNHIVNIYKDNNLREKLIKNGRKTYEESFSIETAGWKIINNVENIISN